MNITAQYSLVASCALIIYLIVKGITIDIKQKKETKKEYKKNLDSQITCTPTDERITYTYNNPEALGKWGEKKVSSFLAYLPHEDYIVFNDVLLLDGTYTTQIDHIIISQHGVFVIETKNIHGKIYGNENTEFWKQYLPDIGYKRFGSTQEHRFRNPIWQNEGHIKWLRRLVFDNDVPLYGIVVFPNETDINVSTNKPVLQMWKVDSYIVQYKDNVMSLEQMEHYREKLIRYVSTNEADREKHLDNINNIRNKRNALLAGGLCPKCGSKLTIRNGEYGRFYACSKYPECKYILNLE